MAMSQSGPRIIKFGVQGHSFGGPLMVSQLWYTGNTATGGRAVMKSGTTTIAWEAYNAAVKDYNSIEFCPSMRFTNLILATLSNGGVVYGVLGNA